MKIIKFQKWTWFQGPNFHIYIPYSSAWKLIGQKVRTAAQNRNKKLLQNVKNSCNRIKFNPTDLTIIPSPLFTY